MISEKYLSELLNEFIEAGKRRSDLKDDDWVDDAIKIAKLYKNDLQENKLRD